jgi:SAM-dependent methyltransferase
MAGRGHRVVGIDPSAPQVARARAAGVAIARSGAERLPFPSSSFDGVVSSCSIKHWVDRSAGVAECLRAVRPGGVVVLAEIDGASSRARLRGFAATTRIPRLLHPLYPTFARAAMVVVSPTAEDLAEALAGAGAIDVTTEQVEDLPFTLAAGRRPL